MFERMLDREHQPTEKEMTLYCGENADRFARLNGEMTARFGTTKEIRFPYGNKYGWSITHRKGKKLICDIFPEEGAFNVMLRLSGKQFEAVSPEVSAYTREHIDNRYPCGDGGWVHYRITCEEHLRDALVMLELKCR